MEITLDPETERYVRRRARDGGHPDPGDYVAELVHREWKNTLAGDLGIGDPAALARELEEGYAAQAERDLEVAGEWAALDAAPEGGE